jgi:tetratricopeptide (TPR) repeat protein
MKTSNLLNLSVLFLFFGVFAIGLTSCKSEGGKSTVSNVAKADLIQRSESIQLGKEWDEVQNSYSDYTKAIDRNNHDNKSKIQLAQLYIKEARVTGEHGHYYPAALAILDNALTDSELTSDLKFLALTTKAGVQLSLHEFADALKTGNQAAILNPANAQIHGVLVDANVELGNYAKAVKLSDKMITIKPDIRSYSRVSYLREIHGDVDGSIEAMTMAVKAGYPGYEETAWAMLTLGDIYKQYGQLDNALQVYKEILDMRPNYPFAVGAIGEVQAMKGMDKEAEETLKEAMSIIPEVGFYISLAELYKKQGRTAEMEGLLEEIMVMLKEDTDSGHNMNLEYANIYLNLMDNPEKAMEYAKLEYAKRPKNIDVNRTMAQVNMKMDNKSEVENFYTVAKKTNSNHPELSEIKKYLNS